MKRIFFLLSGLFLIFAFVSCNKDDTPEVSMKDALKISAYVYNEDGETWGFQQLPLNEPKKLVPTYVLQDYEDLRMVNFNLYFDYEYGICMVSVPNRDVQLSVGRNGGIWKHGEDMSTRVYDFQNDHQLTLSRAGYMAVAPYGFSNHNIWISGRDTIFENFEPYIGQEYLLTVKACDFEKNPVITAQVKLTSLEDGADPDGESRHFSIEIVSYEYSDFYKMMEGAG